MPRWHHLVTTRGDQLGHAVGVGVVYGNGADGGDAVPGVLRFEIQNLYWISYTNSASW